ncbi:rhodanese-like domain-containing protein [Prosthecochloris sp. N3]|uniref:Rhodanese-like domain-containing protein n=2 Tax=Prosthecochloris ethylica TaxID=2743976 RepID=A0ABR9XP18_9CHLB|nr:rhodanese-like domain-containing protein [Prosthecochloris ethylica]MBF0585722.1 rhodanese-like domain-containing protein [Prosthecochloris ethylica]MBF0635632.1 rhodanese-like domain-containing protein [Prosthecochloris ethylica]NUK46931.1 rhodanese-like domain-containing protein [Prosthecochloris ethylica]
MMNNLFPFADPLALTETMIERSWPWPSVTVDELAGMLEQQESPLLFDVREREEFDVSRIRDARHLEPSSTAREFMERHGGNLRERHAVFYCSVGQRSSEFIDRVHRLCQEAGSLSCSNLKGGIFRWYNTGYPVVNTGGVTDDIHEYNALWGIMVRKREASR